MNRTVEFVGATAVITGGASGIGKGIAKSFLANGSNVVIADIDAAALAATAQELGVLGVRTDVTDPESVQALADRAVAEYGEVHVVCNNAGVGPMSPISKLSLDDWKWMLDVNLYGVIYGVHSFLPILKKNQDWGHIVNTSSMSVMAPPANLGAYVAAKAAVLGLTEVLATELEQEQSVVGATALIPGPVRTNIATSLRTRPAAGNSSLVDVDIAARSSAFRFLEPEEVGEMVLHAIRDNRLYVASHAEWLQQAAARHARIQAGFPAPQPA
ncbi:NAD(P)-dependent dehydrogenase (short-subunit alcohol dehydrogenase family) [Arthrobacter globiformis]|uniref:SDR family NAD(P)-dependent oxidoreductase n=1 Tax=Arthrobacter globiformis TaxID=1665 RepID=UPI0027868BF7|nr:SDR family NAD(P)-dependent oxidoreductase [Arthrobacter globiformis]MDQ1058094.1 NAD(P)-dependent dehydrogenase (short-subunit alcohol dehydrogenase family) [Arthrobacter globiformis]